MFVDLFIVVCVGLLAAGTVLIAFRSFGKKAPKVLMVGAAGAAMIAYTTWSRYTWADRTAAALPEGLVVVQERVEDSPLEPWTKAFPRIDGLVALDRAGIRHHPDHPGLAWVSLHLMGRDQPATVTLDRLVDCRAGRWMALGADVPLGPDGLPQDGTWVEGGEPAELFRAVCSESATGIVSDVYDGAPIPVEDGALDGMPVYDLGAPGASGEPTR